VTRSHELFTGDLTSSYSFIILLRLILFDKHSYILEQSSSVIKENILRISRYFNKPIQIESTSSNNTLAFFLKKQIILCPKFDCDSTHIYNVTNTFHYTNNAHLCLQNITPRSCITINNQQHT
jgi:hypothetical protein